MGYTLIGGLKSRAFRVAWMLEELGQDYAHVDARPHSADVTKHNPTGKIPVLLEGNTALTDSVAIITYLADKHEDLTARAGTPERARQDAVTNFLIDDIDGILFTLTKHTFGVPKELRHPEIADTLKWEIARAEGRLADVLGRNMFLMGDAMTVPDIVAVHCLNWGIGAKLTSNNVGLRNYARRLRARDAYQRAWAKRGE